jgi:hypothetical protein
MGERIASCAHRVGDFTIIIARYRLSADTRVIECGRETATCKFSAAGEVHTPVYVTRF